MKISKTIRITYLLTLLIALLSCASKQHIVTEEEPIITQPKLLFLNFEITKLNDIKSVSLINQIKTDGKLKGHTSEDTKGDIGDLEYLILDKDLNQLEKHYIKNPLKKVIEFVNDSGNFEKKMLDLDRSEFSLKLQLKPKAEYIAINEITSEGITKLNTTKIE
ncbi:hypothetical protein DFQ09_106127 [Winogradskyella pacifica]|uniref:Lipoprotein n=1 Tax=Winogradskyella pacifica TaxID=664642 RepID=A0A3D9LPN9_9FLAO|nr:hypothetical protein [Winogradskyella pacifica]REE08660.1 hypothetical protein DFQ09_106127 [Winogradskyella pacifica]